MSETMKDPAGDTPPVDVKQADPAPLLPETPPADPPSAEAVVLVPMVRDDAPFTADVHPDEVANYAAGGWVRA